MLALLALTPGQSLVLFREAQCPPSLRMVKPTDEGLLLTSLPALLRGNSLFGSQLPGHFLQEAFSEFRNRTRPLHCMPMLHSLVFADNFYIATQGLA